MMHQARWALVLTALFAVSGSVVGQTPRSGTSKEAAPGKVVGLLVDGNPETTAGPKRRGPENALCLSVGGGSYRTLYVSDPKTPEVGGLRVPVGPEGKEIRRYDNLSVANLANVKRWGVKAPFTLVEVEINNGRGAPASGTLVATRVTVLEGDTDYPLQASVIVPVLRKQFQAHAQDQESALALALAEARQGLPPDRKASPERERQELVYATWLPGPRPLQVRFEARVQQRIPGGADLGRRTRDADWPGTRLADLAYGAELAVTYEVSREGRLEKTLTAPVKTFRRQVEALPPKAAQAKP